MAISIKRKRKSMERLNLIPIMDAIFIFIFFLLMSAQFIDIYEIGSDAPAVSTVTQEQVDKKEPLNLTLKISSKNIQILTGLDGKLQKTIKKIDGKFNFYELLSTLTKIKQTDLQENSVILKPDSLVSYEELVKIMDEIKEVPKESPAFAYKDKKGKMVKTRKLYDQIIFETI